MVYKRILLKLSGEQLAGTKEFGIDRSFVGQLSEEVTKIVRADIQLAIVVGGGNFLRGADFAGKGVERSTADYMGMLATILNGLALQDLLVHHGVDTRLQSNIQMNQVAEPFIRRRAIRHMEKGRVVVVAGGTGKPYVTTDTAAVGTALDLDCEVLLKATKVDGIYDKDPAKHDNAQKLAHISFQQAVADDAIRVMDKAALGMAVEHGLPIVVFDALVSGNISRAAIGESVGTTIG